MKFHLPLGFLKALMAVVCVPGTTIAADAIQNTYTQQSLYNYYSVTAVRSYTLTATKDPVTLYWDSTSGESAVWDTVSTVTWVTRINESEEETAYEAGAEVEFGEGTGLNKSVQITSEGVSASVVKITGNGYQFSGGNMVVTENLSTEQSAKIDSVLVMGSSSTPLKIQVDEGKQLTASILETSFSDTHEQQAYEQGSFEKTGAGTLSITDAMRGAITGVTVKEGKLELATGVSMNVGANEIKGGTLENVEMLITGEIDRAVSGDVATAHNIIKSADGDNAAVLTDVTLHAGTSTEYATLQNVSFAGNSILRGYITFEETQRQRDMSVAAGGTLTVDNVCFDLHGLASGDKVLIVNNAVDNTTGTLTGWDTAKFVYSGITVNSAAVNSSVAGMVTLNDKHNGNLYWIGTEDDKWNADSTNWSTVEGGDGNNVFTALSNVYFGANEYVTNHNIAVAKDLVVMNFNLTGGNYSFSGGRIATLGNAAINTGADKVVTFNNQLVVQGSMETSGTGTLELHGATTVVKNLTLGTNNIIIGGDVSVLGGDVSELSGDVSELGKFTVISGSDKNAGSLYINGNVTAQEISISVSAGEEVGNSYNDALVNVTGNLSVGDSGKITIGGTAEQHYLGVVQAKDLTVNTQAHDVYFDNLQVESLTVAEGSHVHVRASSAASTLSTSSFPTINLSGTLALDAQGVTYDRGYNVYVENDAASLFFGPGCTIDNMKIIGKQNGSDYTNVGIEVQSRSATVTKMSDLGNLTVELGSLTAKNASGAVHGELILDNGKLKLAEGSDDIMASGSGAVRLMNGGRLDIGTTTQTFSANNEVFLSGASSITGDAEDSGLRLGNDLRVNYEDAGNSIDAKMTVEQNVTLNSTAAGSSLEISGLITGSGVLNLTGPGTVALSGANSDFKGQVTVQQGSTLTLQSTDALVKADVTINDGATLSLNTPGTANVNTLTLINGSSLAISSIVGTDEFSDQHAVLNAEKGVTLADNNVELNVIFADKLKTMTTYNIMTGVTSIDGLSFNVQHNGASLDASQYKIALDPNTHLLYMQTMMGNVWEGESSSSYGTWSKTNTDGNWSNKSNYNENAEYNDAIFGDLDGGCSNVYIEGTVAPGDVYFVADGTDYTLSSTGGKLAAGTDLHQRGESNVILRLYDNVSAADALGDVNIKSGSIKLEDHLAVAGDINIAAEGTLVLSDYGTYDANWKPIPVELRIAPHADGTFNYTISNVKFINDTSEVTFGETTFSGVTIDADGVRGTKQTPGYVTRAQITGNTNLEHLNILDSDIKGGTLSNVTLSSDDANSDKMKGYYRLQDVTIGENVVIAENACYSLVEDITFKDALTNKGVITITNINAEIGQIDYTFTVNENGKSAYTYEFIEMVGKGRFDEYSYKTFETRQVLINGINLATGLATDIDLATGLATGIGAEFIDNEDGSFTLSVGKILAYDENGNIAEVDGTVGMPQWDERWGKQDKAPGISRRYYGTNENANFVMASGADDNARYYMYDSIVNSTNADKVNNGKAIVVTLSSIATGKVASAGTWGSSASDHEVWIYDRSGFETVIGGQNDWVDAPQSAATHILVNVDPLQHNVAKNIIGGSYRMDQNAESFVTVQNGNINLLVGGSSEWGKSQAGTAHVFIDGGTIGEIFAAGYDTNLTGTQIVDGRKRAVEMVLTGGTLGNLQDNGTKRVFGGGHGYTIKGDIYIRMEGNANVTTQLVGGSNGGTVEGDIVLDLISGAANRVDAAGLGWEAGGNQIYSYTNGNVLVNLYSSFNLGSLVEGSETEYKGGSLYGGKENGTSYVKVGDGYTSTLHFARAGLYDLGCIADDGYTASQDSVNVTGFDRITMEEGAHAVVALGMFDNNMDTKTALEIRGKGIIEVIGHGANFGRDIQLQDDATLKISTSVIGQTGDEDDHTITVNTGSTIDFSGFPLETQYQEDSDYSDYAGLGFNVVISGDGANGMGALYKGKYDNSLYPKDEDATSTIVNRIVLPNVVLTGNASVGVVEQEYLFMNANNLGQTELDLKGHTLTKLGGGDFIARSVTMTAGTILVQQGAFGSDLSGNGVHTDMVLAAGAELKLDSTSLAAAGTTPGLELRSLSGSGTVILNGSTLTLNTGDDSKYYEEYMDEAKAYDQFTRTTGFGYAVFSGLISDGDDSSKIAKTGDGVHYISGSSNTYTGGTQLQGGRLYLLGTGEASEFSKGMSEVASGVAGTGAIIWSSADAELYLGHNARIYNAGTTNVQGGIMTIGVEGAPNGVLADYVGIHSKDLAPVVMGGVEYVEIETHNLKSIAVNAQYADGTEYVANTDIDRNKMLLVKKSDWDTVKNTAVTGFSDTGYNEAIYSGVLDDSNNVAASLHKVGVGTLVLDQSNSYTGGTEIKAGTLRLRGWGTLGDDNVKDNVVEMTQTGATLMFTYNSGYGEDEPTELANDIIIIGTGDARWVGNAATDEDTAALISAVGPAVTFTLSGDISGTGNVRHSGEGVLVLSGDSSYTGGTYVSRGTLEVQSAAGLGATASGQGSVTIEHDADLKVTVEEGFTAECMVTTLAADANNIQGDVLIRGTADTERILHMASNGYNALSTTLEENGTLLINGVKVTAASELLTGNGRVVVSDLSGSGSSAKFASMIDYTGDFSVEGDNASISVTAGTFSDGSIHVAGRNASVSTGSDIFISAGNFLHLYSTGNASQDTSQDTAAKVITDGAVSIEAGAIFYVRNQETCGIYNLSELEQSASYAMQETVQINLQNDNQLEELNYLQLGIGASAYNGRFDEDIAANLQAVGVVQAKGGLTLAGGSTYETTNGHTNLMGASLTLDTMENSLLTFNTTSDVSYNTTTGAAQLVLFSGVNSVYFVRDNKIISSGEGIVYTLANRYLTGWEHIDDNTLLVFDSYANVVYLEQQVVPEPTTATLSLVALAALAMRRRRRK